MAGMTERRLFSLAKMNKTRRENGVKRGELTSGPRELREYLVQVQGETERGRRGHGSYSAKVMITLHRVTVSYSITWGS